MSFNNLLQELLNEFNTLSNFNLAILIALGGSVFAQLFYYLIIYSKFKIKKVQTNERIKKEAVSIVISARNEAENLKNFLPSILEQDYPNFEVIVVNDCSQDNSEEVLSILKSKYSHLYVTNIRIDEKFSHGKKLALTIGIKAAKNEWLLLTDADCKPVSKNWISDMQQHFTQENELILAYGGYFKEKGLTNLFIRTDTVFIAMQYLTFAKVGFPYMGVGRNLAYRKSLFFKNRGFAGHMNIASGDDDLFINEVAKKSNTEVVFSPESFTLSIPKKSFKEWTTQKKRHLKTSKFYKKKNKLLLGGELISRFIFFISMALLFFSKIQLLIFVAAFVFVLRTTVQLIIFNRASKILNETNLLAFFIFYDIFQPIINLGVYLSNVFSRKKTKWR